MNVCYSGGAKGSDLLWGELATLHGHDVVHYSFTGHRTDAPLDKVVLLSDDELQQADFLLADVNRTLKRKFPTTSDHTNNLLRRNFYQIKDAELVYAISWLLDDGTVQGGTGWAVEMAWLKDVPVFLYCQEAKEWFCSSPWQPRTWDHVLYVPPLSGRYAGIGSRKLLPETEREMCRTFGTK